MTNTPTDTSVQKLHKSPPDTSLHKTQTSTDDELVEAGIAAVCKHKGQTWPDDFDDQEIAIGRENMSVFLQSILPLLASREAAVLELVNAVEALPVQELVEQGPRGEPELRGYGMEAQGEWDRVRQALRTLSKGETP